MGKQRPLLNLTLPFLELLELLDMLDLSVKRLKKTSDFVQACSFFLVMFGTWQDAAAI